MVKKPSQDSLDQEDSQTTSESKNKKDVSSFQNKVIWSPAQHAWLVKAKKVPKKKEYIKVFPVDPNLLGTEFSQARTKQFRLAVQEWNMSDGSKRDRITLPEAFGDLHQKETTIDPTEHGSQPSLMTEKWHLDASL